MSDNKDIVPWSNGGKEEVVVSPNKKANRSKWVEVVGQVVRQFTFRVN
jgi:hypothetical protein